MSKQHSRPKAALLAAAIGVAVVCAAPIHAQSAHAQSLDTQHTFHIEQQSLPEALITFSQQSGIQVVTASASLDGVRVPALTGELSAREVLDRLLQGSGLRWREVGDGTIVVEPIQGVGNPAIAPEIQELEGIVVTAQKREEHIRDVPISIVALNSVELGKRKLTNLDQLALIVPGVAIQSTGETRQIQMRGLGNVVGTASSVGLYMDEAAVTGHATQQLDLPIFDLARVEVLRGPQGTLYGEGSLGGTIRFITNEVNLDRFGFDADVEALLTKSGAASQRVRSAINIPLLNNTLGLRVASLFDHSGGWIDQPAAGVKDYNGNNLANVRAKLLWKPTDSFAANLTTIVHDNDSSINTGEDDDGNFTQVFDLTATPATHDRYELHNLTMTYDVGNVRLLSTTTHLDFSKNSRNSARRIRLTPPGTPLTPFYTAELRTESRSFTQELRAVSTGLEPFQWTVGGSFRRLNVITPLWRFALAFSPPPGTPMPPLSVFPSERTLSQSWAIFGDASYKLADRLNLGVGLRYFEDDRALFSSGMQQEKTFHALSPRFYAKYDLNPGANIYGSVSKGFRSGGFNLPTASGASPAYNPEKVWTYELGAKADLMQRRIGLEVALFQTDYSDYQIQGVQVVPTASGQDLLLNLLGNAGEARVRGVEASVMWRFADEWTLTFRGDYLDHEFTKITLVDALPHVVGDRLDLVPDYGFTTTLEREFSWRDKDGYVRVDYSQKAPITYVNRTIGPWYAGTSDTINLLNVGLSLRWSETLTLDVFGQNLLNDRGYLNPYRLDQNGERNRPLTWGVGFSVSF